jgi:N-methylhydantoinase A
VTDADVVLGRIDPGTFAGGTLRVDVLEARKAVVKRIGSALGLDELWAAAGIGEIVEENMASAARVHAIERGKVPERCAMIAFGGAGPLHAARLAARLGMRRVLVPLGASVGSAIGFLRAPVAFEVVRSLKLHEDAFSVSGINKILEEMQEEATAIVAAGALGARLKTFRSAEMRYSGQGHEISIALPPRALKATDAKALRAQYEARYEAQFGLRIADVPVEFLTWSVNVSTLGFTLVRSPAVKKKTPKVKPNGKQTVFDPESGKTRSTPAYERERLAPGARLSGPALIVEAQTTTLVPRGWRCGVTAAGHLLLEKGGK